MRGLRSIALALALLAPAPLLAGTDACELSAAPGGLWDHLEQVVELPGMTVLVVTRFQRRQGPSGTPETRERWTDDVPSDRLGTGAICDRMQIETPLPMESAEGRMLTMQQGERLHPERDLAALAPALLGRLTRDGRIVEIPPGRYYVSQIADQDAPGWRPGLLARAAGRGRIETGRWMIGLAGALYLVPLEAGTTGGEETE